VTADPIVGLEATLHAAWDADTAAVYADLLTARGDPRGELIAIDLALATAPTPALHARKREVIEGWIPAKLRDTFGWQPRHLDRGLLRWVQLHGTTTGETIADQLATVLEAVGDRISDLSLWGQAQPVVDALALLANQPLPWLGRLQLHRTTGARAIGDKLWSRVIAATPNLRELTIIGKRVVTSPIHPAVTTLRLRGGDGIVVGKHAIDAVTAIELAFENPDRAREGSVAQHVALAPLVNPRTFPALRSLDLSRNEPLAWALTEPIGVLAFVEAIEDFDRIERLRLPAIRDPETAQRVLALLEAWPRLHVEIARVHRTPVPLDGFVHPRLSPPPDRVWPASAHSRSALTILCAGVHTDELALSSLIDQLDEHFDRMDADAKAAWIALWSFLDELPWEDDRNETVTRPFPAATLRCALEALEGDSRADAVAKALRAADPAQPEVLIERYWGW
jgi:hypothetical protein